MDSHHVSKHLSLLLCTNSVFCKTVILAKQNMWRDVFSLWDVSGVGTHIVFDEETLADLAKVGYFEHEE